MAEYIEREAVLQYLKERSEYELNSISPYGMIISHVIEVLARDIEDMPYFVKGELETTLEVTKMKHSFDDWLVNKALSAICRKNTCDNCLLNSDNPNSIGDCGQLSVEQVRALLYLIYKAENQ